MRTRSERQISVAVQESATEVKYERSDSKTNPIKGHEGK